MMTLAGLKKDIKMQQAGPEEFVQKHSLGGGEV